MLPTHPLVQVSWKLTRQNPKRHAKTTCQCPERGPPHATPWDKPTSWQPRWRNMWYACSADAWRGSTIGDRCANGRRSNWRPNSPSGTALRYRTKF